MQRTVKAMKIKYIQCRNEQMKKITIDMRIDQNRQRSI